MWILSTVMDLTTLNCLPSFLGWTFTMDLNNNPKTGTGNRSCDSAQCTSASELLSGYLGPSDHRSSRSAILEPDLKLAEARGKPFPLKGWMVSSVIPAIPHQPLPYQQYLCEPKAVRYFAKRRQHRGKRSRWSAFEPITTTNNSMINLFPIKRGEE